MAVASVLQEEQNVLPTSVSLHRSLISTGSAMGSVRRNAHLVMVHVLLQTTLCVMVTVSPRLTGRPALMGHASPSINNVHLLHKRQPLLNLLLADATMPLTFPVELPTALTQIIQPSTLTTTGTETFQH